MTLDRTNVIAPTVKLSRQPVDSHLTLQLSSYLYREEMSERIAGNKWPFTFGV